MEKLLDFFKNLQQRFSNPLIFSFCISWLFVNWKIPVALLSYNSAVGSGVQHELINQVAELLSEDGTYSYPLLLAVTYTFLGPIAFNLISGFNLWAEKWGDGLNLWISNGWKVPFSKYFKFRKEYEKRSKILEDILASEQVSLKEQETIKSELFRAKEEIIRLKNENLNSSTVIANLGNLDLISGNWKRKSISNVGVVDEQLLEVMNSNVYIRSGVRTEQKYQIQSFFYNSTNRTVRFMLYGVTPNENGFYSFEELEFRGKEMAGWTYKTGSRDEVLYSRY